MTNTVTEEEMENFLERFVCEPKDLTDLIVAATEEANEMCFDREDIVKSLEFALYSVNNWEGE